MLRGYQRIDLHRWIATRANRHRSHRLPKALDQAVIGGSFISTGELEPLAGQLSLKAASAALGKAHASAKAVVSAAGVVPAGSRRGVAFHIPVKDLEQLGRRLAALIDCQTAAKLLGIGRVQFRSLVGAKLAEPDAEASRLGTGQLFDPKKLEGLVNELAKDLVPLDTAPRGALPLPIACRDASVPLWKVCRAIIEGRLQPIAHSKNVPGLGAIWVIPAELRVLAAPRPRPVTAVSRALGIHPQAASELIRAGAFGNPPELSDRSLEAFAREYAKPADLAALLGSSGRSVINELTRAKLAPAFGPPRCRQLLYARSMAVARLAEPASISVH